MDPAALRQLLNDGIQAIRAGDRAHGRAVLLRVVAEDERLEPAWLWLSATLDDPADQLVALENVLVINPSHAQALAGVAQLRHDLGQVEPSPDLTTLQEVEAASQSGSGVPPPPAPSTAPAAELVAADDDPLQCAFCGQPTVESDERCPHCQRSLLVPGLWRGGGHQYTLLILVGMQVQAAMLQTAAAYLLAYLPNSVAAVPGVGLVAASPLIAAAVRLPLWAIILTMLLGDSLSAYRWAALLASLDLGWQIIGWGFGWVGVELAALNGLLSLFIALGGLSATIDQAQARQRLKVVPDRGIQSGLLFKQRAEHYAQQGMWALAALHWQKAIGRQPREAGYYKALGQVQAHLGRHAQAVRTFRSGAEWAPNDPDFPRLIQSVRATARIS